VSADTSRGKRSSILISVLLEFRLGGDPVDLLHELQIVADPLHLDDLVGVTAVYDDRWNFDLVAPRQYVYHVTFVCAVAREAGH